ncbi:MAG TPA: hypothetical protein VE422_37915 [Terriglobia bacterium]|nr:hypothetical protein [Terriglobia bacterium]
MAGRKSGHCLVPGEGADGGRMFGKKLSEYFAFQRWILILIAAVWLVRLVLSMAGMSGVARWASINIVVLAGLVYFAIAVHTKGFGSYKQLLGVLFIQTALAHVLIALAIALGILTGTDSIYTAPEFFGGNNGRNWAHVAIHLTLGVFLLPLIGWLIASPILFFTKKLKPGFQRVI